MEQKIYWKNRKWKGRGKTLYLLLFHTPFASTKKNVLKQVIQLFPNLKIFCLFFFNDKVQYKLIQIFRLDIICTHSSEFYDTCTFAIFSLFFCWHFAKAKINNTIIMNAIKYFVSTCRNFLFYSNLFDNILSRDFSDFLILGETWRSFILLAK